MKKFLTVGQIINTHGINGELKVYPLTDDVKRFKKLDKIYIDGNENKVVSCKIGPKIVILKIENIDSIDEATKYRQKYIEVSREDAVSLKKGSYFIADIVGCHVVDENGLDYGEISDVIQTKNNDVYWIKGSRELLIPALKNVVVNVNVEDKKVIIRPLNTWQ